MKNNLGFRTVVLPLALVFLFFGNSKSFGDVSADKPFYDDKTFLKMEQEKYDKDSADLVDCREVDTNEVLQTSKDCSMTVKAWGTFNRIVGERLLLVEEKCGPENRYVSKHPRVIFPKYFGDSDFDNATFTFDDRSNYLDIKASRIEKKSRTDLKKIRLDVISTITFSYEPKPWPVTKKAFICDEQFSVKQ